MWCAWCLRCYCGSSLFAAIDGGVESATGNCLPAFCNEVQLENCNVPLVQYPSFYKGVVQDQQHPFNATVVH